MSLALFCKEIKLTTKTDRFQEFFINKNIAIRSDFNASFTNLQVELLFRRALMDPNGIYTLAFIDELDYSVSEQAFRKLEILLKEFAERGKDLYSP